MKGQELRRIAEDLWTFESFFTALGCKGSLRMTIIRRDKDLLLHSPVRLTDSLFCQLQALGSVSVIVAPNLFHHLYLRDAAARFPAARLLVPTALPDKIGAILGAEPIGLDTNFGEEIEHFTVAGHGLQETLLYHRPSKTLITADLLYHYTPRQFFAEKLWFRLVGGYGKPGIAFYHRFSIRDRASLTAMLHWVSDRQVKRVIVSHGDIVTAPDAGAIFVGAWKRFLRLDG